MSSCSDTLIKRKKFLTTNNVVDLRCYLEDILKKVQKLIDDTTTATTIPPIQGHIGDFLVTDGTKYFWAPSHLSLIGSNFEPDTISYKNSNLKGLGLSIWLLSVGRFIYESNSEFTLDPDGGFTITVDGFTSATDKVEVFVKSTS